MNHVLWSHPRNPPLILGWDDSASFRPAALSWMRCHKLGPLIFGALDPANQPFMRWLSGSVGTAAPGSPADAAAGAERRRAAKRSTRPPAATKPNTHHMGDAGDDGPTGPSAGGNAATSSRVSSVVVGAADVVVVDSGAAVVLD